MRSYNDEAVIINRLNFGEAGKLITFFSKNHGKIILKAKGIRRLSSKRAGSLELFNLVKISAVSGRGDLDILTEVQVLDSFPSWRKYLGRINLAYQLCEVVDKLLPEHQPHPQIYRLLAGYLGQISGLSDDWEVQMDIWLTEIVEELGYLPPGQVLPGNIRQFIESLILRPLNSPKVLKKLVK